MFKFLSAVMIAAVATVAGSAQTSDYKKGEFFVGYSNGQVDTGVDSGSDFESFFDDRQSFNGVNVSGVYNVNRYLGIKGDMSATFDSTRFSAPVGPSTVSFETKNSLYNFVGGVQLKNNSRSGTFKPFVHVMAGAAHGRTKLNDYTCTGPCNIVFPDDSYSDTGLAGVIGGGIDIRVSDRVQIRAIQVDYNPTRLNGFTQHNARFGVGLVF